MNPFKDIFDAQKAFFATGVTRSYEWRVEQLDRMAGLLAENEAALQKAVAADFKTASQECGALYLMLQNRLYRGELDALSPAYIDELVDSAVAD